MFIPSTPMIDRREIIHPFQVINDVARINNIEPLFVLDILELPFKQTSWNNFYNALIFKWESLRLVPLTRSEYKQALFFLNSLFDNYSTFENVLEVGNVQILDSSDFKRLSKWGAYEKTMVRRHAIEDGFFNFSYLVKKKGIKKYIEKKKLRDPNYLPEDWFLLFPIKCVGVREPSKYDYKKIGYKYKGTVIFIWDVGLNVKLPLAECKEIPCGKIPSIYFKRTAIGLFFKSQGLAVPSYLEDLSVSISEEYHEKPLNTKTLRTYQGNDFEVEELKRKLFDAEEKRDSLESRVEELAKNSLKTVAMAKIIKALVIDKYGEEEAKRINYFDWQGISEVINTLKSKNLHTVSGKTFEKYFNISNYLNVVDETMSEISVEVKNSDISKY